MPLQTNATLRLTGFEVDDAGVELKFVSPNPGPGQPSDYNVRVSFEEVVAGTDADFAGLVQARLLRKLRATGLATRLSAMVGREFTV